MIAPDDLRDDIDRVYAAVCAAVMKPGGDVRVATLGVFNALCEVASILPDKMRRPIVDALAAELGPTVERRHAERVGIEPAPYPTTRLQ